MLTFRQKQSGVSLVEIMVGLVVTGLLLGIAIPNFRNWIQSGQIRTGAESVENGLQLALSNAVTFNSPVQFTLTGANSSWTVGCVTATAKCPALIQSYSAKEGAPNAVVTPAPPGQVTVIFNGLGRVTPAPANPISFSVTNPAGGGTCVQFGGPMRCLEVHVSAAGDIRMCDPALTAVNRLDPQAC